MTMVILMSNSSQAIPRWEGVVVQMPESAGALVARPISIPIIRFNEFDRLPGKDAHTAVAASETVRA